jgi:two-component system, NarL family, sensor histidine kinase UhpB
MLKAVCLSSLFTIGLSTNVVAQSLETDSLINLLSKSAEDTNKVHLYWKTGASIIYQDAMEAARFFSTGVTLAQKLNFISGLEKCYNGLSLSYSLNAKYDSAKIYIDKAVEYAVKAGNLKRLAVAYLNRADVQYNLHNFQAALKDCDTAIKYTEQLGNKDGLGRVHSVMSSIYVALKQYDEAIASIEYSDKFFAQTGNRHMIGMNLSGRAEVYALMEQPEKAIPLINQAIAIADSLKEMENLSAYYQELAMAHLQLKNYDVTRRNAQKSLDYAIENGNIFQQGSVYDVFVNLAIQTKNYKEAISYGLKGLAIFQEAKDMQRTQEIATHLADAYYKSGNTTDAYKYLTISKDLNDSLLTQKFTNETAMLQTTFQFSEKEKEIQLLSKNEQLQHQKLIRQRLLFAGAAVLLLLSLIGIGLLINRNKLKQRMKELELRNQIAADLHDEVGSSLSSIHMLSQMATQQSNEATHKDILTRMSGNAKETMDKMGDIVWMIKPGESEGNSLKQRMERFVYEICSSKNIGTTIELDELEKIKLTMEQRKNVYLIFKEALNNAVKYSGTEKIEITASGQNKQLTLLIKDYGKGFNTETSGGGNGLDNMKHRADELKGKLEITSEQGAGTTVTLIVPL